MHVVCCVVQPNVDVCVVAHGHSLSVSVKGGSFAWTCLHQYAASFSFCFFFAMYFYSVCLSSA